MSTLQTGLTRGRKAIVRLLAVVGFLSFSFMFVLVVADALGAISSEPVGSPDDPPPSAEARAGASAPGEAVHVVGALGVVALVGSGLFGRTCRLRLPGPGWGARPSCRAASGRRPRQRRVKPESSTLSSGARRTAAARRDDRSSLAERAAGTPDAAGVPSSRRPRVGAWRLVRGEPGADAAQHISSHRRPAPSGSLVRDGRLRLGGDPHRRDRNAGCPGLAPGNWGCRAERCRSEPNRLPIPQPPQP